MSIYEIVDVIITAVDVLIALGMFVVALLTFLHQRKKK